MWFLYALITMLAWGAADLFYKKGNDESDRYSHLKTSIAVGAVMGIHAICVLIFGDVGYNILNIAIYLPVSLMYILSMTVGYFGLRYLELSICSPIQNTSGAVVCLLCLLILGQKLSLVQGVAVAVICAGVVLLGIFETMKNREPVAESERKYKSGFAAFLIPLAYCGIDAAGTFFDAYYLDDIEKTPLVGVTEENFETVANISYELTFFICALCMFIYLIIKKQSFRLSKQKNRAVAAIFETAGQFTYVFALSGNGAAAAPMIAAYSAVSVLLSRIFLGEKLTRRQYAAVIAVIIGITVLGAFEE